MVYRKLYVFWDVLFLYLFGNVIIWEGMRIFYVVYICYSGGIISYNFNVIMGYVFIKGL